MTIKELRPDNSKNLKDGIKDICTFVNSKIKVTKAAEIGTYLGESTCIFIENFPDLIQYVGVDPYSMDFNSDNLFTEDLTKKIFEQYVQKMQKYKCHGHIKLPSTEASKHIENHYFDFIYIDGCHQYNSVVNDIKCWLPKVRKGGIISFHDVDNYYVNAAISQFFNLNQGHITQDNSITFEV